MLPRDPRPSLPPIPEGVMGYLGSLIRAFPAIESIWLFGSRANPGPVAPRDWDFLVFDPPEILTALRASDVFRRADIDIFIVYDGIRFESPWPGEDGIKIGRLQNTLDLESKTIVYGYRWELLSETEATYDSTRPFGPRRLSAFRIYSK